MAYLLLFPKYELCSLEPIMSSHNIPSKIKGHLLAEGLRASGST